MYVLQAFICRQSDSGIFTERFDNAVDVAIGQGLSLVPMAEGLFDQINNFALSPAVETFEYLTENIERVILDTIGNSKFAYVEAEYFGGTGGQTAIVWNNAKRESVLPFGADRINQALKEFGVTANSGQDAFSTLGLGRHRHTSEWIESATPWIPSAVKVAGSASSTICNSEYPSQRYTWFLSLA